MSSPGRRGLWLSLAGATLIIVAVSVEAYSWHWTEHSKQVAHEIIKHQWVPPVVVHLAGGQVACRPSAPAASVSDVTSLRGILRVPKIGVEAPVLQGTADAQLAVAVGHASQSVWPGHPGTAAFLAHDVSFFSNINRLVPGDVIEYATPCLTYTYRVTAGQVVKAGTPVFDSTNQTVVLVTCWPTNALWYTPDRYLVTGVLQRVTSNIVMSTPAPNGGSTPLHHNIPPALVAQGLTLATNSLILGTMNFSGTPSATFVQSTAPLNAQAVGIELYLAGIKALGEQRADWWAIIAPHVAAPSALFGHVISHYRSKLDVTLVATGVDVTTIQLTADVGIDSGPSAGEYHLTVQEHIKDGALVITSWVLAPR